VAQPARINRFEFICSSLFSAAGLRGAFDVPGADEKRTRAPQVPRR